MKLPIYTVKCIFNNIRITIVTKVIHNHRPSIVSNIVSNAFTLSILFLHVSRHHESSIAWHGCRWWWFLVVIPNRKEVSCRWSHNNFKFPYVTRKDHHQGFFFIARNDEWRYLARNHTLSKTKEYQKYLNMKSKLFTKWIFFSQTGH